MKTKERQQNSFEDSAGKYLRFSLSNEVYGLGILKVMEIFGMMPVTRVPLCPDYVMGVINLRGRVIPIIDLRTKLGLTRREYDEKTCIIVTKILWEGQSIGVGIIVDTVLEVTDFPSACITHAPNYGSTLNSEFILGMATEEDKNVTVLLDIDRVFSTSDSAMLGSITNPKHEEQSAV